MITDFLLPSISPLNDSMQCIIMIHSAFVGMKEGLQIVRRTILTNKPGKYLSTIVPTEPQQPLSLRLGVMTVGGRCRTAPGSIYEETLGGARRGRVKNLSFILHVQIFNYHR